MGGNNIIKKDVIISRLYLQTNFLFMVHINVFCRDKKFANLGNYFIISIIQLRQNNKGLRQKFGQLPCV